MIEGSRRMWGVSATTFVQKEMRHGQGSKARQPRVQEAESGEEEARGRGFRVRDAASQG
jgi:hypothetical protein